MSNTLNGEESLFLAMADSCKKHMEKHHGATSLSDAVIPRPCATALERLSKILPKVEAAVARVDDLHHLLQLYQSVLASSFCPYAAQILFGETSKKRTNERM
jgi:hypothetical protein